MDDLMVGGKDDWMVGHLDDLVVDADPTAGFPHPRDRPLVVGIAGGSGSGKTTVVTAILDAIGPDQAAVVAHDAYYHDYEATVRPTHLEFVEPSKRWADVLIPRGGSNTVAIDMVVRALRESLAA